MKILFLALFIILSSTWGYAQEVNSETASDDSVLQDSVNSYSEFKHKFSAPGRWTDEHLSPTGEIINHLDKSAGPGSSTGDKPDSPSSTN